MKVLVPLQRLLSRSDFCDVFSQKAFGKAGPAGQPGLRSQGLVGRLLGWRKGCWPAGGQLVSRQGLLIRQRLPVS